MRQNRRRTGSRRSADDKIKYMRMAAIPLVIVLVLVAIILVMDRKPSDKEASAPTDVSLSSDEDINISSDSSVAADDGGVEPDNNQYTTDFSQYELKKDEIPQVNQLISEYFQAKVDQDAETLYRIFGKSDDTGLDARKEELKNEAVYIEDYVDIVCYTKPGLTEDSYVAYVTYEVKFRRVDTLAPGLMWCYVVKDDNGNYIIRENVVGDEADYVAKQNQSEDVKLLSNQVNERLRQAIEGDTVLAGIYQDLRNGAVVHSSEEETEAGDSKVILEEEGSEGQETEGQETGDPQPSQEPSAGAGQNSQGEGIQNVPAGQDGTETQGSEGTQAAARESQGTDSGASGSLGASGGSGTAGGSNVKIE